MGKSKSLRRGFQKDQPNYVKQDKYKLAKLFPSQESRIRPESKHVTQVTEINFVVAY